MTSIQRTNNVAKYDGCQEVDVYKEFMIRDTK